MRRRRITVNSAIFIVEAIAGFQSQSLSLIMDSVHNFSEPRQHGNHIVWRAMTCIFQTPSPQAHLLAVCAYNTPQAMLGGFQFAGIMR